MLALHLLRGWQQHYISLIIDSHALRALRRLWEVNKFSLFCLFFKRDSMDVLLWKRTSDARECSLLILEGRVRSEI